jgi:hypothetical protein
MGAFKSWKNFKYLVKNFQPCDDWKRKNMKPRPLNYIFSGTDCKFCPQFHDILISSRAKQGKMIEEYSNNEKCGYVKD